LFGNFASAQILIPKKDYVPKVGHPRYSFSISLISGANSTPVSFGIYRQNPDSTVEISYLTLSTFVRQAMGYEKSVANPDTINYFETYGIEPKVLDILWKLKYDSYPYGNSQEKGWGTEMGVPTKGQYQMLNEFGIQRIVDYSFGDNVWKFLKKVSDPAWQIQYEQRR
jgi:hypothetical protein